MVFFHHDFLLTTLSLTWPMRDTPFMMLFFAYMDSGSCKLQSSAGTSPHERWIDFTCVSQSHFWEQSNSNSPIKIDDKWLINGGDPNHLLIRMIIQVVIPLKKREPAEAKWFAMNLEQLIPISRFAGPFGSTNSSKNKHLYDPKQKQKNPRSIW